MNILDISLLVLLGGFGLYGFWFGIVHIVGAFLGLFIGAVAAGRLYVPASAWIEPYMGGNTNLAKVVAFFLVFVIVSKLAGLLFWFIEKIFKFITVIPFMKTFNRLLGAALGLVEGTLMLGLVVYFAARFPISAPFATLMHDSTVAGAILPIGAILAPLLPYAVRAAQSFM
jgi:uncharacterized membrane protein required for colicin V production